MRRHKEQAKLIVYAVSCGIAGGFIYDLICLILGSN